MLKLLKHLKSSTLSIVLVVFLLIVQAVCDLSLPDYTSNIVNVGIQQSGIENAVPKAIRKTEMEKLMLFIEDSDKEKITDNYILLDKNELLQSDYNKYVKEYPNLEKEPIYKLNTKDKDVIEELNSILGKPIIVTMGIEKDGLEKLPNELKASMGANAMGNQSTANMQSDPFQMLSMLPKENLKAILDEINEEFDKMPESIITQSATFYIKEEYKVLGIDIEKLQNKYILYEGGIMLLVALISMVAVVGVAFLSSRIAAGLGKNLRHKVFRKVVNFSNSEFDEFSTASLITRSTNDIQQIQMMSVMLIRVIFYAPILALGGILKVITTDTSMAWIIGVAVMAILTVVIVLFSIAIPKFKAVQKLLDKLNLVTREILTGMLVIRAFSTEKHEEQRFDKANRDLTKTNLFVNRAMSSMMPIMMLIMNCITILIVWVGAHKVDQGTMQVGNMMAFIQYTMQIIMAFLMISMLSVMIPRASVCAQRIQEVLDKDLSIKDPEQVEDFADTQKGYVEFKNVSFKYPHAEDYVLENINFTAKPGETTAFIGSTGSGKSTLINLIPRFYDVTEGCISIDGVDVRKVNQHDLREKIGYIPQKGVLFSGDIESNLKYGKEDATYDDLVEASEIAQAMEFITSKPEGFETKIAQGGTNVSGGQKQRLSIARALVKKPEIYIFDDSFSALDFKTDAALRKALNEKTGESTVLIVAQRISTIMYADQIVVLDEGKVVGIGTHDDLLSNCEVYNQIAVSQLSKEELNHE